MPGIIGIITSSLTEERKRIGREMLASLQHESTYETGTIIDQKLGLFAGYTAHKGSFAAGWNRRGAERASLLLSGECFDDEAPTTSNENWMLQRYAANGESFASSLNGLFSGVVCDREACRLVLFNDRYGLERIYIYETPDTLYFASEAKALLRIFPKTREFDEESLSQFLAYGCTLGHKTLFRGITLLPPASCWIFSPGKPVKRQKYFSPTEWEDQDPLPQSESDRVFAETFRRILPRYTTQPEALGIALTGGLDTRMIMACLPPLPQKPVTYTFSGQTEDLLDASIAGRVAATIGLEHRVLRLGDDFLSNFGQWLDRSVYISDGCCNATGAHELYFNRQAAQLAPIRLTGNFGSEVFRSVSTFKPLGLDPALLAPEMAMQVNAVVGERRSAPIHPVTFAAFQEIPSNLVGTLFTGRSQVSFRTPYLDNELVKLAYRAPLANRSSPLPALRLIETANPSLARIPTDRGQMGAARGAAWFCRRAFSELTFKMDYYHTEGLPGILSPLNPFLDLAKYTGLLGLHKFLPYARWFKSNLNPYLKEVISDQRAMEIPYLSPAFARQMLDEHGAGTRNYTRELNIVFTLESVNRCLLRHS